MACSSTTSPGPSISPTARRSTPRCSRSGSGWRTRTARPSHRAFTWALRCGLRCGRRGGEGGGWGGLHNIDTRGRVTCDVPFPAPPVPCGTLIDDARRLRMAPLFVVLLFVQGPASHRSRGSRRRRRRVSQRPLRPVRDGGCRATGHSYYTLSSCSRIYHVQAGPV